jgi:four helix bundle protein
MNKLDEAKHLQDRTRKFAVRVIKAFVRLPKDDATRIIGRQFLRSGTSSAANYRAACRARSAADFISKISVVAERSRRDTFLVRIVGRSQIGRHEVDPAADERM